VSVRTEGRIVDENNAAVAGLRVAVRWPAMLFGNELGSATTTTASGGRFAISYGPDPLEPGGGHRELELVVQDEVGRVLLRAAYDDTSAATITRPDDVIPSTERHGLLVTLGRPNPPGQSTPVGFSTGNAVTMLMDEDAFVHAAQLIRDARRELLMSQLFFALPPSFDADATREKTSLVFDFQRSPGALDAEHLRAAGAGDARPERLLITAADLGVDVRILMQDFVVPLALRIIAGILGAPFAGLSWALDFMGGDALTNIDEAHRYFDKAANPNLKLQVFPQPALTAGFQHAKLIVADGERALSLGSPFGQSYVDTHDHRIDAPKRGGSTGLPKHDASFAVTGPAAADVHDMLRLLWDTASDPSDRIASARPQPPQQTSGGDGISAMQVVRTLSSGRFEPPIPDDGEKGILEAYLRAIASAQRFIYLENQYFTNDAIGEALVAAMQRNPNLQVIVLLNIEPDVPLYPFKQRRLITRIREAIGENAARPTRFAVFTRWTHELDDRGRPRMLPIYVHAKLAIVDDTWATVGSANLDGYSLDALYPSDIVHRLGGREARAIELNAIFLNTPDHPSPVVDLLRRKVWAEHLGFAVAGTIPEVPDVAEPTLATPPSGGWLALWRDRAKAKLDELIANPGTVHPDFARVLPWPVEDTTYKTPRKHLDALGVTRSRVLPLKSTRRFDFETGQWVAGSVAAVDVN
jgi:phosphatidylserine/phosphatidylglycerophosphate/cardiolipin synthase-like enzyme